MVIFKWTSDVLFEFYWSDGVAIFRHRAMRSWIEDSKRVSAALEVMQKDGDAQRVETDPGSRHRHSVRALWYLRGGHPRGEESHVVRKRVVRYLSASVER